VRASELPDGLWAAEFAGWRVQLEGHDGRWSADLRWVAPLPPPEWQTVTALRETGFASPAEAFTWAALQFPDTMVLGAPEGFTMEAFLSFQPVLSAVP
jgi:hypothetical protein